MFEFSNECVGCEHCGSCGAKHTPVLTCDNCGDSVDSVYRLPNGEEYCEDCLFDYVVESNEIEIVYLDEDNNIVSEDTEDAIKGYRFNDVVYAEDDECFYDVIMQEYSKYRLSIDDCIDEADDGYFED